MPSDGVRRRLHPASVIFHLAREVKSFGLPLLVLIFGGGSNDGAWRFLNIALLIPAVISVGVAVTTYFRFTYEYGEDELIIRSGMFFKNERHIPYTRIQNIDATQNVAHRVLGVYAVTLETGGGAEAEGTLSVLPAAALTEMRRRVVEERTAPAAPQPEVDAPVAPAVPPPATVLLHMSLRDLMMCGLVRGRGLLLLAAIVGAVFDFGLDSRFDEEVAATAENPKKRGPLVRAIGSFFEGVSFNALQLLVGGVVLVTLIVVMRVLSMIYTVQKLFDFTLALQSRELRMTYGSLTRVRATIPVRRIQTLTVQEGPLHRLFGVSSVRADTAGGEANKTAATGREWLAPIIKRADVAGFVRTLMPEVDLESAVWEPPHPRALRRAHVKPLVYAVLASALLVWPLRAWAILPAALFITMAVLHARLSIKHMGHALAGDIFMFKSGWLWRHITVAPVRKVQAVGILESPFDRRHGMAGLRVDTAGAAGSPHRLNVRFLARDRAGELSAALAGSVAQSPLSW